MYQVFGEQAARIVAQLTAQRADLEAAQRTAPAKASLGVTLNWNEAEESALLLATLGPLLEDVLAQASQAVKDRYRRMGVALSWEIYDAAAAERASVYKFRLIKDLNASTREQLGKAISQWIRTDADFEALVEQVRRIVPTNPYPVLRDRARLIAQTETTRIYADSRMAGIRAAGLRRLTWQTANDELVCPICAPLHDKSGTIAQGVLHEDSGAYYKPPAHPGCRCWLTEDTDEMDQLVRTNDALPVND